MKRTLFPIFVSVLILSLILTGCSNSRTSSTKVSLSKNEAGQIIIKDLAYHGIKLKEMQVNKITTNKNGTIAVVEYIVTLDDGSKKSGKSNLIKDEGEWEIEGHQH